MFGKKEDKSVTIKDGGINKGIINTGDNVTIETPHIIPQKLTPQIGLANDINFVGRKEELQKVDELLNQNSMLLLLNGIGGIGKSTLASYYLNQHKDNFDYYGFVQVNEDIKLSLASAFGTSLDLKKEKIDDLFAEIMNKLQNLEGKKLLIIDDVKEMDSQLDEMNTLMTLKNSGFQILFTSRETKEYIPQYFLDIMNVEDARELFLKYYPTKQLKKLRKIVWTQHDKNLNLKDFQYQYELYKKYIDEMNKVNKILKYLDYHTLFIEMTAKSLNIKKRTLSLEKLIDKFENQDFTKIKRDDIQSYHKFLDNFSLNDIIIKDKNNLLFIKRLSILPSIKISFDELYKFLVCDDEDKLDEFLIKLIRNGWLIELNDGYKFHQILRDYILEKYRPKFEDIESIIDYFIKIMENIYTIEETLPKKAYLDYLNSITQFITTEHNEKTAYLIHANGYLNFLLGKYKKAQNLYTIALKIRKNVLDENDIHLGISINNEASMYEHNGDYKQALKLYLESLKIRESYFAIYPDKVAIGYNNVGRMYAKVNNYDKALYYLTESLNIRKEIFGEKDEFTARAYNVLGSFFQDISVEISKKAEYQKMLNKAFEFLNKSLNIRIEILSDNHPDIANSYSNIANYYLFIQDWDNAINNYNLALNIYKKGIGDNSLQIGLVYSNIGTVYGKQKEWKNSMKFKEKALQIWKYILPENHPNFVNLNNEITMIKNLI